ncbi:Uncharacterised protein [Mycobacterium tuberculosis]|nr:Uncharacterised protein [Mycobacterium tuberculosis]
MFHNPGGDVDVDAEPVGGQPLRPAGVDTDPHSRCIALHFKRLHSILGDEHGSQRDGRIAEHRHDPVAQPFDDVPAGVQEGGFDSPGHLPQQREGGIVTSVQRPRGKADQVGEHQRHLRVCRPAGNGLGQRLPHLQHTQADLARGRIAIPQQPIGSSSRGTWTTLTRGGQRVAEFRIARQQAARPVDE